MFILLLSVAMIVTQIRIDKKSTILSPHILFQVYFAIQLPLNLFLGTNYYLPRFIVLSPLSGSKEIAWLGALILAAQVLFVALLYLVEARPRAAEVNISTWPRRRTNAVCIGIFGLGYGAFLLLIYINGGFAAFAETRELWRTAGIGGQGWVLFPATTMMAIAMCAAMINNREAFRGPIGLIRLLALYVAAVLPASQLGFRSLIFLPLLQAGFFYHFFIRRFSSLSIVAGSFALMIAFTLYGIQREATLQYNSAQGSYIDFLYYVYFTRPDITYSVALRSMGADILQITMDHMHSFGDYTMVWPALTEAATIAIPAGVWPGKPLPLLVQYSRNVFGIDGGVSPTIVGEGYWHAGIVGVIIFMTAAALLHAYFRNLQSKAPRNGSSALMMLSLYPSLIMMAESFQGYFNGIVLIAIANWLFRRAIGTDRSSKDQDLPIHGVVPYLESGR